MPACSTGKSIGTRSRDHAGQRRQEHRQVGANHRGPNPSRKSRCDQGDVRGHRDEARGGAVCRARWRMQSPKDPVRKVLRPSIPKSKTPGERFVSRLASPIRGSLDREIFSHTFPDLVKDGVPDGVAPVGADRSRRAMCCAAARSRLTHDQIEIARIEARFPGIKTEVTVTPVTVTPVADGRGPGSSADQRVAGAGLAAARVV